MSAIKSQNDRAYQRASQELIQRRKERLKAEIGFEREKRAQAAEQRRENRENRVQETHKWAAARAEEKLTHMKLKTVLLESKVTCSKQRTNSLANPESATYRPAAA